MTAAQEGLVGNDGVKALVEELNQIHVPGDDVVTPRQIRKAINKTVLRLSFDTDHKEVLACQKFEHYMNELAGYVPDWGFNEEEIQHVINNVIKETNA